MRLLFAALLLLSPAVLGATERSFPYEAVVIEAEEPVRSGQGAKYYPTGKLRKNDRVTVHRHDPGGWYMIAPPAGSFSWIDAQHVDLVAPDRGQVRTNRVIARVGSEFGDDRDFYQRELSTGEEVEVLGEKTFQTERGPVRMLKIAPPRLEYRWIRGQAVVPADALPPQNSDPFSSSGRPGPAESTAAAPAELGATIEPEPIPKQKPQAIEVVERPLVRTQEKAPFGGSSADQDSFARDRAHLQAIDEQFRNMLEHEPTTWDLAGLEQEYREFQAATAHRLLANQVETRVSSLGHYAQIQQEYEEFVRLTAETNERDAQLLSMQQQEQRGRQVESRPVSQQTAMPLEPVPDPAMTPAAAAPAATPPAHAVPQPGASITAPGDPAGHPAQQMPRFDGAGIIQRSAAASAGGPRHVLIAPDGRVLAYLHPEMGINLDQYVGQSMGVMGRRSFRPELRADLIIVRGATPVRLRGMPQDR